MTNKSWFVNVLLPLPLTNLYTYSITAKQQRELNRGSRVIVQFGTRKYYTAIVIDIHNLHPENYEVKQIISILDNTPIVNEYQLMFWQWISDYYMCTEGEVYKAALPSGLKLESETRIFAKTVDFQDKNISASDELILNTLNKNNGITLRQLNAFSDKKISIGVIKSMLEKGYIGIEEKLLQKYQPKLKTYIRLAATYHGANKLNDLIDKLERAPKQLSLLLKYINSLNVHDSKNKIEIEKATFLKRSEISVSILNQLIKKGVFETYDKEISRLEIKSNHLTNVASLNKNQIKALENIKNNFGHNNVVLIHGVTSSGKTEIYFHLIQEQLNHKKQVLYLLPEIALTAQIINRLKSVFGNKVGIYHSGFNNSERLEVYENILGQLKNEQQQYQIILGTRSSVFLPFGNLGLIIIDEEHENSYKQFDPAPRYHARDAAIILAKIHGAKVLLGSATPSLESYYNSLSGKYGLVELNERYLDLEMPEIKIVDLVSVRKRKEMHSHFSTLLINSIEKALKNKEQIILFQNRRGFSPYLECDNCGWIPVCKNCDVSLTYHKKFNRLICHYCGYSVNNPKKCESCGSVSILSRGFGTEKIEDEINIMFPDAKIARLDLDNARSHNSYTKIISGFESGDIDILIGTQMVSKGLDFGNVQVVGILNADNMLNYPDFRSYERSYQLMAQVSGRAGRKNKRGLVIIQTSDPKNSIISSVVNNNFKQMFDEQIIDRKTFKYPPHYRLVLLVIKNKDKTVVNKGADELALTLKTVFGQRIIGPEFPIVSRIQKWYIKNILIKFEKDSGLSENKKKLKEMIEDFNSKRKFSNLQIAINVDPQ